MPSLFYAGQPDYIEKLNTLATAASMTNGTVAASFLSLAVTGTATAASFVGPLTGNASTATTLATARNINGVAFNGSADITVTAAAGTLTGNTLAAGVTASSLTSVGTLTALTVSGVSSITANSASAALTVTQTGAGNAFVVEDAASDTTPFVIDSAGKVGIGTTALTNYTFLNGMALTGQTTMIGNGTVAQVNSDVTSLAVGYRSNLYTQAASFNCGAFYGFHAVQSTLGASSSVSFQAGFLASSTLTGATNNYGFYSEIASGSGRWNFYAVGTAANYFQGDTTFASQAIFAAGSAAAPSVKVGAEQNGLYSSAANTLDVALNGVRQAQFSYTAAAVNYPRFTGSTTGNEVRLSVQGSDTNAGMWLTTKGTGVIRLETGGGEQVRVSHTAAAVNYLNLTGSATGNYVGFAAAGSDTNIGITYTAKGNVSHDFYANNGIQFRVNGSIANATNYFEFFGQAAGSSPLLRSYSPTDSNVNARYRTQGAGSHQFETGSSGNIGLLVAHTASSVNYGQFTGNSAGGYPSLRAAGSDTNIGFDFATQGAAPFRFYTNAFGAEQLRIAHVASAVNYAQITGSATGGNVTYGVAGSDTNISKEYRTKGAGFHLFTTNTGQVQLQITHTASAVNYPVITGSATGNAVTISTGGSDANRSIAITPAGTGTVNIGVTRVSAADSAVPQFGVIGTTKGVRIITDGSKAAIDAVDQTLVTTFQPLVIRGSSVSISPQDIQTIVATSTASGVNYLNVAAGTTGNPVVLSAAGSDTNRSITATAGGVGAINLGNATNGTVAALGTFASAEKAIYILNTTTAPTANPATGGYLYCEGGALKYRGSSGTITTIAAA